LVSSIPINNEMASNDLLDVDKKILTSKDLADFVGNSVFENVTIMILMFSIGAFIVGKITCDQLN
jgi:hypothetical protein